MGKKVEKKKVIVNKKQQKEKEPSPEPEEDDVVKSERKKRTAPKTRVVGKSKLKPHLKSLCGAHGIPMVHSDAVEIVDNIYRVCVNNLLDHAMMTLPSGKQRMLTRKSAESGYLGYTQKCGVPDKVVAAGLQFERNAIDALK